ncbi:hypothetical protein JN086_00025 [Mycolicibacterium austroafricanum]|uniref:DUF222 domain-containing protein n=1 Tax=Mycolicibacterium austroafricanum TaxID=39687 RepID=A0ABT8HPD7_MYCAO|nr:hypothetical protein [Mycolicibacterium austroafricanum]MDN4522618.1 hypothetical protein [Mycolicibacterium austroafricanum]QRZ07021.1 hypothetical protein JN090_00025 [Mycolicibacterium austroafricanum]QZT68507.1 hypothetical protein JN086_00025 [Mycolicibacterium austroafricanum]
MTDDTTTETTEPTNAEADDLSLQSQEKGDETMRTPDDPDLESGNPEGSDPESDPDVFPREVVEELRRENGKHRQRAQKVARRLHAELVRATGRLADPTDLEFAEDHLDDPEALTAAIDELLDRKPHLASRRPMGDIGQGNRGSTSEPFSLLGLLKEHT